MPRPREPEAGRHLAIPRSGVKILTLLNDKVDPGAEETIAAWQSPQQGVPKRVVIRCDGHVIDATGSNASAPTEPGNACAVIRVRYTIGGYSREVIVDAVNQSSLVIWAVTVEAMAIWDRTRIAALQTWYDALGESSVFQGGPCQSQIVAAAISACECGDEGNADARFLQVLQGVTDDVESVEIPPGARAVRFLNGTLDDDGSAVIFQTLVTGPGSNGIAWGLSGISPFIHRTDVTAMGPGATALATFVPIPAGSTILTIGWGTVPDLSGPLWLEWIYSPTYLS